MLDRIVRLWERLAETVARSWRQSEGLRRLIAVQGRRTRRWPLVWMSVYAAIAIVLGLLVLDRPLAFWFKARVGGEFEGFWKTVTNLGLAGLWLIPTGLMWGGIMLAWRAAPTLDIREKLGRAAWIPGFIFLSVALSGLLNSAIKYGLGRYRPRYLFDEGLYGFTFFNHSWAMNSFPSGHSQAIFAAMTALTLVFPRYDIAFIAVAVLVAVSRVLTTVHFFSDAVMGAWLGTFVTLALYRALTRRGIRLRLSFERDKRLGL